VDAEELGEEAEIGLGANEAAFGDHGRAQLWQENLYASG
jgi:hypothetical protein